MDKNEDWKCRFSTATREIKTLFEDLDESCLATETIFAVLNDFKLLMEAAIKAFSAERLKVDSVELLYVNDEADLNLQISLEKFLWYLWHSPQTNGLSAVDIFLENLLLGATPIQSDTPPDITVEGENGEKNDVPLGNTTEEIYVVYSGDAKIPVEENEFQMKVHDGDDDVERDESRIENGELAETNETNLSDTAGEDEMDCSEIEIKIEDDDSSENLRSDDIPGTSSETSTSYLDENFGDTSVPSRNVHGVIPIESAADGSQNIVPNCQQNVPSDDGFRNKRSCKVKQTKGHHKVAVRTHGSPKIRSLREGGKVSHTINFLSYKCFLCESSDRIFCSFKTLSKHISSVHAVADEKSGKKVLYCSKRDEENCLWTKKFAGTMARDQVAYSLTHLIYNHNRPIPNFVEPFLCPHANCTYKAIRKFNLDSHMACHENELVPCKDCGKMLKKRSMNLHRTFCEVSGLKVKLNACPVKNCGKSFKTKYTMIKHVQGYHENVKSHPCVSCKKSFVCKTDHDIHMFARHGVNVTGRPTYSCPVCSFVTLAKTVLRRHISSVHSKIWQVVQLENGVDKPPVELESLALEVVKDFLQKQQNGQEKRSEIPHLSESLHSLAELQTGEDKSSSRLAKRVSEVDDGPLAKAENCDANFDMAELKTEVISNLDENDGSWRNCDPDFPKTELAVNLESGENVSLPEQNSFCSASSEECDDDEDKTESPKKQSSSRKRITNGEQTLNFTRLQCFLCPPPSTVYKSIANLFRHVQESHSAVDDRGKWGLLCPECPKRKQFRGSGIDRDTIARLLTHLVTEHKWEIPEYIEPHYCPHPGCSFVTIQHRNLAAHQRRHSGLEKVPCDKCGKCMNPYSLRHHLTYCSVNINKRRAFACDRCEKTFTTKQGLQNHVLNKHEGIKNFLCTQCTNRFSTIRELEEHAFNIHRINFKNRPILSCPECSFITIRSSHLNKHCRVVHAQAREHPCPICNRRYKTNGQLKVHMSGHLEKTFKCQQCDFRTARKTNLQEHIQAQHLGKLFRCEFCGYRTGYLANLHKHLRISCQKKDKSV